MTGNIGLRLIKEPIDILLNINAVNHSCDRELKLTGAARCGRVPS